MSRQTRHPEAPRYTGMVNLDELLAQTADAHAYLAGWMEFLPRIDDTEIVNRTLALANDNSSLAEIANAATLSNLTHGVSSGVSMYRDPPNEPLFRRAILGFWEQSREDRQWFHEALLAITKKRQPIIRELRKEVGELVGHLVVVPRLTWTGKALQREDALYSMSTKGTLAYVLMLILDEDRGLTKALKQCKLGVCGRFFISRSSGGRPPLYCSRDHQEQYAALSGAERTERWRKKQRKKR